MPSFPATFGGGEEREAVRLIEQVLDRRARLLQMQWDDHRSIDVRIVGLVIGEPAFGTPNPRFDISRAQEQELLDIRRGILDGDIRIHGLRPNNNPSHGFIVEMELHIPGHALRRGVSPDIYRSPPMMSSPPRSGKTVSVKDLMQDFLITGPQYIVEEKVPVVEDIGVGTEPILAYRDFEVKWDTWADPWIQSRNGVMWPALEPLIATCGKENVLKKTTHDAPKEDCECGIYAFADHKHTDLKKDAMAWGEVLLWGDVFICETGYRAEYAYPKTLFVRDNGTKLVRRIVEHLQDNYGVPVHLAENRDKTASEWMDDWIKEVLAPSVQEKKRKK